MDTKDALKYLRMFLNNEPKIQESVAALETYDLQDFKDLEPYEQIPLFVDFIIETNKDTTSILEEMQAPIDRHKDKEYDMALSVYDSHKEDILSSIGYYSLMFINAYTPEIDPVER